MTNSSTDKITTLSVLGAIALIATPIALYPKESADFIRSTYLLTVDIFGATYMIFGACMLLFVLYIAFSKFGNHRLGGDDIGPDYSLFSWACMLFCSGIDGRFHQLHAVPLLFPSSQIPYVHTPGLGHPRRQQWCEQ